MAKISQMPTNYRKVGRLSRPIALHVHRLCADIFVSENYLKHIQYTHENELKQLGFGAFEYVRFIVSQYNEIRAGKGNALLLIVRSQANEHCTAVIDIAYNPKSDVWEVKTAQPRNSKHLERQEKLWSK